MNSGRFRLVYSQCLSMFVPVSETTKTHGRKASAKRTRSRFGLATALFSIAYTYDAVSAPPITTLPTAGVVTSGAASINTVGNAMTVNQSTQKAIINWGSFSIGSAASVNFAQPNSASAVLNRVSATGGLSQIYGNLTANGQVYLINPNGILFGNGATVNVNSLVASSLDISDNLFNKGFLSLTDGSAAFSGTSGYVQVDAGATLTAASGGKILMFAPNIENNGLIQSPDGQTLLAAGQKVYLTPSSDPNLRGILVEVDSGGTTTNLGSIIADRGNITLAGIAVNQNGRVTATTSVTANGSIKLQAQDTTTQVANPVVGAGVSRYATVGGAVVLGANSITEVLPDATDTATVLDSVTVNKSVVDVEAQSIHLMNNAMIVAPSGNVSLTAELNPFVPTINGAATAAAPNASTIYFESGSGIDVSGIGSGSTAPDRANETAARVSVANNVVLANLRSSELADSPLQRNGILYKANVYVDSTLTAPDGSVGTSVANVSGYTSQIQHGLAERLADGGTVKLQSEGNIVMAPDATINVSGGKVDYIGGTVNKTRLLASNGQIYDIVNAPNNLNYVAIQNVSYQQQGYTQGSDAGSVFFSAPAMVLEGSLQGSTVAGIRQRTVATRPQGATLQIGQNTATSFAQGVAGDVVAINGTYVLHSDLMLDASHTAGAIPAFGYALTNDQQQTLLLGTNFTAPTGFSNLLYYADGQITVKNGTNLAVVPGGSITLKGGGVAVEGNLTARSGTLDLSASGKTAYIGNNATFANNATGNVEVGAASSLDASGLWTNDRLNPSAADIIATAGGSINISAGTNGVGDVLLDTGSTLNASGGAWLNASGKISSGNGGDIELLAGQGLSDATTGSAISGKLRLDGTLHADSLATGGSLTFTSGTVTIGSSALGTTGETLINPTFFQNGGFTSYDINGFSGLTLADNTTIAPEALTRVLNGGFANQKSGTDIASFSHLVMLPAINAPLTRAATDLSLSASNQGSGILSLELGSQIVVDPGANVSLLAKRQLTVLGSITAPAGNISMTEGKISSNIGIVQSDSTDAVNYLADQTLWLGANSLLDVSGVTNSYTNANGLRVGTVEDAGSISLKATKGEVVAVSGAQLKLNGADAVLAVKSGNGYAAKEVASQGGSLNISAREGIMWDATMQAFGGNQSVAAGSLSVALPYLDAGLQNSNNQSISPDAQFPIGPREIILEATGTAVPAGLQPGDAISLANNGLAYMLADKLQSAGFDSIQFAKSNDIRFAGAGNLTLTTRGAITLDTPNLIVNDGVNAVLTSSYVSIGNSQNSYQNSTYVNTPTTGTGTLTANANYINLFGEQSLSGIGFKNSSGVGGASFNSTGDIQLSGVTNGLDTADTNIVGGLQTAGDISFSATRIYPSTLSNYTLSSIGTGATILFVPSGADTGVPFSVLGNLNVVADNITQDGVLRAPFGVINLSANNQLTLGSGSLTSVSAEGETLPFGTTLNGTTWNFDEGDRIATITSLPQKNVSLNGQTVNVASGSKVDVSGGGDLSAWEFTPGTGGSNDVLAASGVFAVMPGLTAGYMPGNSESYSNSTIQPGDSIYLSGGNGLAAGYYVLLPAHYALLPGGYSVTVVAGTQDFTPQQNILNRDGSMLVSGYLSQFGGITADSRTSAFLVASGNVARTQSELASTLAGNFFSAADSAAQVSSLPLPADAGSVAISAVTNLVLDGSLITKHSSASHGADVDISSANIAISGDGSQGAAGFLTLSSDKLNAIGAENLTIGAKTSIVAAGTQLNVTASNVELIGGAKLTGQEITLAATNTVSMASGTSLSTTGAVVNNNSALIIGDAANGVSGDGALLRVSTGAQRDLIRSNVSQSTGALNIQSGASVSAAGSIIADATNTNSVNGNITLADGGAIRLGAPKISFGTPTGPVSGLLLDNSKLAALGNPSNIQLKSYSTIDFYGTTAVGNANLQSLTFESAGLAGFNNAGNTVTLAADTVKFANPDGATFAPTGTLGTGTLQVNAGTEIGLGSGTFNVAGFNTVNLNTDQVIGESQGTFSVAGNLAIDAGRITAAGLSNQTIQATGSLQTAQHAVTGLAAAPLGGNLTITADTIIHGGIIDTPSGVVTLNAIGSVGGDSLVLLAGSQINAEGSVQMLGTVASLADGGTINLQTSNGNLRMDTGAVLNVSATGGAGAGTIAINTAGSANLAGTFNGAALAGNGVALPKQGSFEITANSLGSFADLNIALQSGQFNESRNIHVAQGDLAIAATDTITAHNVTLTTDDGNLSVAGTIDASGSKGGIVTLNAGQQAADGKGNITLASSAIIKANATTAAIESAGSTGDGGKVTLNTATDSDTSPSIGSRIIAAIGSVINVNGKGLGSDGQVTLRAPRLGIASNTDAGTGIAVSQFGSTVTGANASIVAEGVKVYKTTSNTTLDNAFISTMTGDNASFLANSDAIASSLGLASDARFVVASGDEVRSAGDITVANDINLQAGGPGALTLRAAGNVNVNANISAGFTTADTTGALTTGGAWTYRIASGANINSADVLATNNAGAGNFKLAAGKLLRTGTGDIDIATGGDFNLASATSVIYTAGQLDTTDYSSLGNFTAPTVKVGNANIAASYSINGGDITITSKGNINGAYSKQLPADWLFRQGRVNATTGAYTQNTSWWTYFNNFQENVGALGGGDININSAGAITDLSAVIATNGRVFGTSPGNSTLVENGGGDLTVHAGGNISGGLYMVDKGVANIRSEGALQADSQGINTAFALGDSTLDVATLGQLDVMTVFNPTLTGMSRIQLSTATLQQNNSSAFSTYAADSDVKLTSVSSGVTITSQLASNDLVVSGSPSANPLNLLPGSLEVAALGGNFNVNGNITLAPAAQGDLKLAANGSINLNGAINMSDEDPAVLPSVFQPISMQNFVTALANILQTGTINPSLYHDATLLHQNDSQPVVLYAGNDIVGTGSTNLFLPKSANIYAGNDILNLAVNGQNLNTADVTTIAAGQDITNPQDSATGIRWGGPGYVDVSAGRNIDLGTSYGIVTRGNLDNPFLPDAGAGLSILVGAAAANDSAFIAKYINPAVNTAYSGSLTSFVESVTGSTKLSDADAWAKFQTLSTQLQHQFVQTAFFNELEQAGVEHNSTGPNAGSYQRGYDAIATYFPNNNYAGQLDLAFSQIKTERGGNLNVMAPGGGIVVGLPKIPEVLLLAKGKTIVVDPNNLLSDATVKAASAGVLGIFTANGGNINLFSKDSIEVAQSREFTIAGGDILNWSTTGDIDAGKGAKTASSAPPPLIRTDNSGNTIVDLSGVVSGSGIGTLQTLPDVPPGNVTLIAPAGTVNAGDAGIRSSGNLLVAAQRVIGADNITVGGTSSGVPAVSTTNVSFNAPASADSSASSKQGDQLAAADQLGQNSKLAGLPSVISVEVISLGDESSASSNTEISTKKCKDDKNKKDCAP